MAPPKAATGDRRNSIININYYHYCYGTLLSRRIETETRYITDEHVTNTCVHDNAIVASRAGCSVDGSN